MHLFVYHVLKRHSRRLIRDYVIAYSITMSKKRQSVLLCLKPKGPALIYWYLLVQMWLGPEIP